MSAETSLPLSAPTHAWKNLASMGAGMVVFLLILFFAIQSVDSQTGLPILMILMVLQLTPAAIAFTRGRFNYIAFIFVNHFISYSFAKFNLVFNVEKGEVLTPQALNAIYEMIYSTLLIYFSYTLTRVFMGRTETGNKKFEVFILTDRQLVLMAVYAASVPLHHYVIPPGMSAINQTLVGTITTLMFCSKASSDSLVRWLKFCVFVSTFLTFLNTGSLAHFVSIATILFMTSLAEWKVPQLILLGFVAILGTGVNSVKGEFRTVVRFSEVSLTFQDRAKLLGALAIYKYGPDWTVDMLSSEVREAIGLVMAPSNEEGDATDDLAKSFTRVGDDSLERVLEYTPSRVPFWNGSSYSQIPYMFIPRILWPGKPSRDFWNRFGKLYEFISDEDKETSVGVNFLAEGYMNFGYLGLYTTAIVFGILVAALESLSFTFFGKATYFGFLVFLIPFSSYGFDTGTILNSVFLVLCVTLMLRFRLLSLLRRDAYA